MNLFPIFVIMREGYIIFRKFLIQQFSQFVCVFAPNVADKRKHGFNVGTLGHSLSQI